MLSQLLSQLTNADTMIGVTIRHAESEDNLKGVWAGWKDSALSNHGMRVIIPRIYSPFGLTLKFEQQAEALAASLLHVPFNAIYTSDLKRALATAKVIHSALCDIPINPSCSLHVTPTLREQNFGVAEGSKMVKRNKTLSLRTHYARGLFPTLYARHENFPGGESLEDVRSRAEEFVEEMLTALIKDLGEENDKHPIAGVVSHGIFICELVAALLRRGGLSAEGDAHSLRGMRNTAWTKVELRVVPVLTNSTQNSGLCNTHTLAQGPDLTSSSVNLRVMAKVVAVDRHPHLSDLHRQKGGIGSMAHDPKQQDIRKFLQVKPRRGFGKKIVNAKKIQIIVPE